MTQWYGSCAGRAIAPFAFVETCKQTADTIKKYLEGVMRYLHYRVIDDDLNLLRQSYSLRYQVYCMERHFLHSKCYPEKIECDKFDVASLHLGALNQNGEMVGTVRLVEPGPIGLPIYHACTIFPEAALRLASVRKVAEVSRLSISRAYRKRAGDGFYSEQRGKSGYDDAGSTEKRGNPLLVVVLYKGIYQTAKRRGITHLLAATEKSLLRLLFRFKFPFHPIGPETDYFGPVTPYVLDLKELDHRLMLHHAAILDDFRDGLEPEFWPTL